MDQQIFQSFARSVDAYHRCVEKSNLEWTEKHGDYLARLCKEVMPSGSGFDSGTTLDLQSSTGAKLVFLTSYHHMNDAGMYDGWTHHKVIVTPSLMHGFELRITGIDRRGIKEYIEDLFQSALSEVLTPEREKQLCYANG